MILVDTSVWVDHLRRGNPGLIQHLNRADVLVHPLVIGELACGHLKARQRILSMLQALPAAPVVSHQEAIVFLESHRLAGRGLGWIDVHLLASAALVPVAFWTLDRRLAAAHAELGAR
jgi:predicted nucleic acid-binding protein